MSEGPTPPLVDAHAHVFTRDLPRSPDAWTVPERDHSAEDWLATLDRHGIGFGVIAALSLFDDNNRYTLDALARHRGRLRATVRAGVDTDSGTLAAWREAGVVGVRLQWRNIAVPDPADAEYQRFFRRLADAGLHVELLARGGDLPQLLPPIAESGVKLVVDHLGDPGPEGVAAPGFAAVLRALENGRTLVKLAATTRIPFAVAEPVTRALLAAAGPERMVWGSDAPFIGHEQTPYGEVLDTFVRLVPDPAIRHAMGLTAMREWFW
jgi:predicted TIM-barrel fold metal-dependent hydrolase